MHAVQHRDMRQLEMLVADDFTLTTGRVEAEVRDRLEWMSVTAGEYRIDEFEFQTLEVQVYGDAAVARSRYRQTGALGRDRRSTTFRMTDVWIRHPGGWKLHVRHAQPIEGD